jgi:hypothetical protein
LKEDKNILYCTYTILNGKILYKFSFLVVGFNSGNKIRRIGQVKNKEKGSTIVES